MRKRSPPAESDVDVLPDQVATRLLTRASELDAAQRASAKVAELRSAATEAGISPAAFDAALAELQQEQAPAVIQPQRSRLKLVIVVLASIIAIGTFYVARRVVPTVAAAPTVEETFQLRCLTAAEAAELLRPVLSLPTNTIEYSPERAPRVLTISATPEQIRNVRVLLEQQEGSGACPVRPAPVAPQ